MSWIYLIAAIAAEVCGTTAMKTTEGFTKAVPSVITILCYGAAFYLLSLTLRTIPVSIAYAVWSGAGIVLISVIGVVVFQQKLDLPALVGIGLILAGVVVLNVLSKSAVH